MIYILIVQLLLVTVYYFLFCFFIFLSLFYQYFIVSSLLYFFIRFIVHPHTRHAMGTSVIGALTSINLQVDIDCNLESFSTRKSYVRTSLKVFELQDTVAFCVAPR